MIHPVLKIAKIGKNAYSTDPNDFIFHSDCNTFKIVLEDTESFTLAASTNDQAFSINHGLKFIPLVNAFCKLQGIDAVYLPNSDQIDIWGAKVGWTSNGIRFNYIKADATKIYFNFNNTNGSQKIVDVRYFALETII